MANRILRRNTTFFGSISVSMALTTIVVIVMILLLALTINRARENDMVEQYSRQQMAVAKGWAAGIEDLILGVERSVILFSKRSPSKILNPHEAGSHLKSIYDEMGGRTHFIASLDSQGAVIAGYPSWPLDEIMNKNFPSNSFVEAVRKNRGMYLSRLIFLGDESSHEQRKRYKTVFIGVSVLDANNEVSGVIVAALSLSAIKDRYMTPPKETMLTDYWIVDDTGIILTNATDSLVGKSISLLEGNDSPPLKTVFLSGSEGYGASRFKIDEHTKDRYIYSYAPMNIGSIMWSIVVVTPYKNVVSLLRKTFVSIIFGAAGLIIAVIVAVFSIAYIGRRRLAFEERMKRLKEREDWQERLLKEKKTIDGIIEGSPIPTFVIDRDHQVILWNKACAELTGFAAQDIIGTDKHYLPFYSQKRPVIADLIVDRDVKGLENFYGAKKVEKSKTVEGAYEARDYFNNLGGKNRHLFFLAAPIYDDKGEIIASIETLQDVTAEIEMSRSLQEYAETLQNELTENINLRKEVESIYNYLQSLIDSLPDRFYEFGADGIINYISRDVSRQKGLASPEIKGRHFTDFVAPEHTEMVLKKWEDATNGIYVPFELETTDRMGAKRTLLINIRQVKDTDRYVIVQRDMTEFKELERKFYESQKLAAIGHLSAGIAHELRNALSSIKMSLQILEKRMTPQGNDLKRFEIARREVEHLETLVNNVLIYAKPAEPKKKPSDIRKIIDHSLYMAEKNIMDKQIRLETSIAPNLPDINADEEMLAQAFLNLYRNAVEASETNGTVRVLVSLDGADGKTMRVEIEDEGSGIDEEDLPNIFNPFFTKKNYGTGLGLSQVNKIIELHHGTVELQNREGRGAKAVILLPLDSIS
ncbi:MAG: PAS domain S-box protein [Deltaproteobacteria bacterium]|nr:PAS domain S-box protein [Deltaproteobacteria bacterium]